MPNKRLIAHLIAILLFVWMGPRPAAAGRGTGVTSQAERARVENKAQRGPKVPQDQPAAAETFYRDKRLRGAPRLNPSIVYQRALRQMVDMPRYSTKRVAFVPSAASAAIRGVTSARAAQRLGTWTPLGPGNIGGRSRALVIHPKRAGTIYAGGVSGGIWKTTNRGKRWTPVGDNLANLAVNALAMDPTNPNVLYAGTGEGFFRETVRGTALPLRGAGIFTSSDAGATWRHLESTRHPRFHWVNEIVISRRDSRRLYAATRAGVFRSADRGESWTRILDPKVKGGCLDLALRTDRSTDYLFASCGTLAPGTVYRKKDAAKDGAWQTVLREPGMGRTSIALAPSNQNIVYALAASNAGGTFEQGLLAVYRSLNSGNAGSWETRLANGDPDKLATMILSNPIINFVEECNFEGSNSVFNMGWYVNTLAVDPRDPARVWAGGVDLFRSDDGGATWGLASYWWSDRGVGAFLHADQHAVVFHPRFNGSGRNSMFVLNDGGIYRGRNARASVAGGAEAPCNPNNSNMRFEPLNNSYGVTQFYHGIAHDGGRTYLGGTQDNGTVRGSDSRGRNGWREIFGGDGGYAAVHPTNSNVVYVTTQGGNVWKSTDGGGEFVEADEGVTDHGLDTSGSSFRGVPTHFLFIAPFVMDPNDPERLWLGGTRLWRSDDGTANWAAASLRLETGGKASALAVAPGISDRMLIGADDGRIYRSTNATSSAPTWEPARPRRGFVSSVSYDPVNPNIAYATYAAFGGSHVWKTIDAGGTWEALDGAGTGRLPNIPVHAIVVDPARRQRLYIGTDLGVFVSIDGGATWAVENTGFAAVVTESLSVVERRNDSPRLFAFTHGRGVWRVDLD